MSPVNDVSHAGYNAIPTNPTSSSNAPNVADLKEGRLDEFVSALGHATGDPDAELRTVHDGQNVRVLVPSSKSSVPSLWVRFLGALSGLPLLSRSATLRGARLEVESSRLGHEGVEAIIATVAREEQGLERQHDVRLNGQYSNAVRREFAREGKPITKRRVHEVLRNAQSAMGSYGGTLVLERARAKARGTEPPVPAAAPLLSGRDEPLTRAQQLQLEGTPVCPQAKDVASVYRKPTAANRHKELMDQCMGAARESLESAQPRDIETKANDLYNHARSYLIRHHRWPSPAPDDVAVAVIHAGAQ